MLPTNEHELSVWCLAPEGNTANFDIWLRTDAPQFAKHVHIEQLAVDGMFKFCLCGHTVMIVRAESIIKFALACVYAGTAEEFTCEIPIR